jgi:hypothetical protein
VRNLPISLDRPVNLTGGSNGILNLDMPSVAGVAVRELGDYYYLIWIFAFLALGALGRLRQSKVGRAWLAIREDEVAAANMGSPSPGAGPSASLLRAGRISRECARCRRTGTVSPPAQDFVTGASWSGRGTRARPLPARTHDGNRAWGRVGLGQRPGRTRPAWCANERWPWRVRPDWPFPALALFPGPMPVPEAAGLAAGKRLRS